MSEQGRRSSHGNSSWDPNEAVHAALSAKFDCFKKSTFGANLLAFKIAVYITLPRSMENLVYRNVEHQMPFQTMKLNEVPTNSLNCSSHRYHHSTSFAQDLYQRSNSISGHAISLSP